MLEVWWGLFHFSLRGLFSQNQQKLDCFECILVRTLQRKAFLGRSCRFILSGKGTCRVGAFSQWVSFGVVPCWSYWRQRTTNLAKFYGRSTTLRHISAY